ncbi:gephyrin-like molybdotransferase Glp [Microbulbifer sp. TYP-18]|uniref:molybdopterin molybdotransferase MoeA n=1 Tax=Microbulbifer sp. TYP-18 TaxID=3230024 RepID=UPI0034C6C1A3
MADCCSQTGLVPIELARAKLLDSLTAVDGTESVPLDRASGRILTRSIQSAVDLPPGDNSAMDGYAVRYTDLSHRKPLELIGRAFAGEPYAGRVNPGTCVRIMTGALVPAGADTIVMQEQVETDAESIFVSGEVRQGDHIRRRGEDVGRGQELLAAGTRISVADVALLAAAGIGAVEVKRRPVIALLSTGDELCQPGETLAEGHIYDSNRVALRAALAEMGLEVLDLGIVPDDRPAIGAALERAAREADAVITSGGVSVGQADYTRELLQELGQIDFWKVAMKPGKPFAFGRLMGKPLFGLPGNPVSALVTFYQLVVPAMTLMQGGRWTGPTTLAAKLLKPLKKKPGRTDFQRGSFHSDACGSLLVEPVATQGSHILSGLAAANCFIVLGRDSGSAEAGEIVSIEPFRAPLG